MFNIKAMVKGWIGETLTNALCWFTLDDNIYHRINNVTLALDKGGSTQIDHIIVSVYGIFVIESKNYKGWIYGDEYQSQWTQVIKPGKKYRFLNPLRQNYLHIKALSSLLELDETYFHNVIWFDPDCELKTKDKLPPNVMNRGLIPYIQSKNQALLDEKQVKAIVDCIKNNKLDNSWKTKIKHIQYVQNHVKEKQEQQEKLKQKKLEQQRLEQQKLEQEKLEQEKLEQQKLEQEKLEQEKLEQQKLEQEKLEQEKLEQEKLEQQKLEQEKLEQEKLKQEKLEQEKLEQEKLEQEKLKQEKLEQKSLEDIIPNCPYCKEPMVKRVNKKKQSEFWGCAKYPKCWGTRPIKNNT